MPAQRSLFDSQMELSDQLIDQGAPLFAGDSHHGFRNYMRLYPNATETDRWAYFTSITDPAVNKRGTVYSQQFEAEALRILNLR